MDINRCNFSPKKGKVNWERLPKIFQGCYLQICAHINQQNLPKENWPNFHGMLFLFWLRKQQKSTKTRLEEISEDQWTIASPSFQDWWKQNKNGFTKRSVIFRVKFFYYFIYAMNIVFIPPGGLRGEALFTSMSFIEPFCARLGMRTLWGMPKVQSNLAKGKKKGTLPSFLADWWFKSSEKNSRDFLIFLIPCCCLGALHLPPCDIGGHKIYYPRRVELKQVTPTDTLLMSKFHTVSLSLRCFSIEKPPSRGLDAMVCLGTQWN